MNENAYRLNREDFYSSILEFEFTQSDAEQFLLNWKDVIRGNIANDYSPYMENNDLSFLLRSSNGDGDLANAFLQDLIANGDVISDESWTKFMDNQRK